MDRMSAVLFSLLLITTSLAGCFEDRQKIDDGGIIVENEQVSENETMILQLSLMCTKNDISDE